MSLLLTVAEVCENLPIDGMSMSSDLRDMTVVFTDPAVSTMLMRDSAEGRQRHVIVESYGRRYSAEDAVPTTVSITQDGTQATFNSSGWQSGG